MYDLDLCILVTNNDRAAKAFETRVKTVFLLNTYEEVLNKARDFIHRNYKLLTHPQASSLKPNQTPYRTILLYGKESRNQDNTEDILLIENAIQAFEKWNAIKKIPKYEEQIANDYKTIDLSMIENVIPKL